MSTVLIVIVILVVLVVGLSFALGRATYEVDSARDTEYLDLEGAWVRYDVMGGGPPVVLVHGWLSSSAVWDQLARRLAQRFTVYTLDLTGFGESDKPLSGYGIRYGSRLLYAFCAHFGLTRASVIGHDLGGAMAMKLASDHPDVVGRVVLVATPANEEQIDLPTPLWAATLPVVGPLFYALGKAARPIRSMWMKPFVLEPEDVTEEMLEDAASSTPAAMSQSLSVGRREIGGGRLARQSRIVKVPVMIVTGEEDQIVDPQATGVWARSLDQTEVCLMDECGHMPMIERPAEFNAQILAFLTGDARYLEQVHEERERGQISPEIEDEETFERDETDTMEVDIHPDEGEAPAFGSRPSRRHRDDDDDFEEDDTGTSELPETNELSDDESRWFDGVSRREPDYEDDEPPTRDVRSRDLPDRAEEENAESEEDPVIRRLGDRLSGRSPRRSTRSERAERRRLREQEEEEDTTTDLSQFTAGMPDRSEDEPEIREPETREPQPREPETGSHLGGFYTPGEPEIEDRTPKPPPIEEDEILPDEPEVRDEPIRRERPRRRPRRESPTGEGDVPEVPGDLFDWGDSLDDFEPVRRRPKKEEPRSEDGSKDEGEKKPGPLDDEGAPGSPDDPPRT